MQPVTHRVTRRWRSALVAGLIGWGMSGGGAWALEPGLEAGISNEEHPTLALGLHHGFMAPPWLPRAFQPWSLQLAGRLLLLPGRNREASNAALILAPALRYTFAGGTFVEGGIGAALFLDAHLRDRELGTAGQFEDRLAMGWPLADGTLQLALAHYSNASLKPPNDGLEVLSLGYRWRL
ncbi:acyloxyacyl hydrolase [Halomonas sp. YLGW01]|uniref:acyloxyacyl hydrolase n=1 Tax=Halomonas sp. YLGW01 TaxID=2773308 RepID=UPI0017812F44|nr:acyloxyacyl hydrolase [Halomonas sp. YLGW01]